jgi:hypothetical protein
LAQDRKTLADPANVLGHSPTTYQGNGAILPVLRGILPMNEVTNTVHPKFTSRKRIECMLAALSVLETLEVTNRQ